MKFNRCYHLGIFVYLVNMSEYASLCLYEDAYKMEFNWEKWLPRKVYDYHDLNYRSQHTCFFTNGCSSTIYFFTLWSKNKRTFLDKAILHKPFLDKRCSLRCRQVTIKGKDDIPTSRLHDGKSRCFLPRFRSI